MNRRHFVYRSLFRFIALFGACIFLSGCIGAIRLPAKAMNSSGAKIEHKEIDLTFIRLGTTQREEIDHHLANLDTSYDNPRLFWGRWSESRWGYWWAVGMPCNSCMAADSGRLWRIKNLLVTFDENGVVTNRDSLEEKQLWQALHSRIAGIKPPTLDVSQPMRIILTSADPVAILMSPHEMEFERAPERNKPNVVIPVQNLVRFKHILMADEGPALSVTCHTFELSEKSAFGKKVKFCAEPSQVGVLFEYLQQVAPSTMLWQ